MAKKSAYQEEGKPILSVLYIAAVIALLAALVLMYRNWLNKQADFEALVRQVSATEVTYNIEDRKAQDSEDTTEAEDQTAVTEPDVNPNS